MEKINKVIRPCNRRNAEAGEFLKYCQGVYPVEIRNQDEKQGTLCVSASKNGKWLNFCLWESHESQQKLVARFSMLDASAIQMASLTSLKLYQRARRQEP